MLSDSLTWLAAIAFALTVGVWINWYARRVGEDDDPMPRARPVVTTAVFVALLAGALLTAALP